MRPWIHTIGLEHPLTGRIWDVKAQGFITEDGLMQRAVAAEYILLGEIHDNADHHRLQAQVVTALLASNRRPAIAFEMLGAHQSEAVAEFQAGRPADASGLGPAVSWTISGWPSWELYQPIADAAIRAGAPIVPANLSPDEVRQVLARGSVASLGSERARRLGLAAPLPAQERAALAKDLKEAHCNQVPDAALARMVEVQRARDAVMAEALTRSGSRSGAVLVAGSQHVRNDRGVPSFIRKLQPGAWILSLAFREVEAGALNPARVQDLPFDYVWFTPRADRGDPCL